ncbi:MAG: thioredoxin family protein [Deltaproteobacteria bacterium]|nr:thioredoxin family protein [Deltaproteobacteria bacterium]
MVLMLLLWVTPVLATIGSPGRENAVNLYFFWSHGCPHCLQEKSFLEKMKQKYPALRVHSFEVSGNRENLEMLHRVALRLQVEVAGVPFTVVGRDYFVGWHSEETTGAALEAAVQKNLEKPGADVVAESAAAKPAVPGAPEKKVIPEKIKVPILGELETKTLSLGLLTVLIGALDGFNPCAMWVLLLLLGFLLGLKNNKRRWFLGTTFVVASALVYFLIMCAWLNLFLFLGFLFWVRLGIALVALAAGYYNLREYFTNPAGVCKVSTGGRRHKIISKLQDFIKKESFWLALGGIILLAFAVNVVELVCSAGFPVVYLQILSLTPLAKWQYYSYILLYIFIFMLDDLIVFFAAMITLQVTGLSTKYKRYSNLIGGFLMLLLGFLLIFKPEALMFG